ncbi:BPL-N domain-containing protein [Georgenia sp. AZ-5]|uniref:BPL-N domain-containing protein n=1 Tax=Georgenia sp. AZ-5 TaxID=3367526 RepID=UPI00375417C6
MSGAALVYRGPASLPGCPEAVANLLAVSGWFDDVRYVGPAEELPLTADALGRASLYAQPGGGELRRAYRRLRHQAPAVRDFVHAGGRYLGFCLGGYLAGEPGFRLLPGDSDQYIASPGASVRDERDALITIRWRGRPRQVYFQDGPYFDLDQAPGSVVLAEYDNGLPAAVVCRRARGVVGVVGPHPEAGPDWFTDAGLPVPAPAATDLGLDLVDAVMRA